MSHSNVQLVLQTQNELYSVKRLQRLQRLTSFILLMNFAFFGKKRIIHSTKFYTSNSNIKY